MRTPSGVFFHLHKRSRRPHLEKEADLAPDRGPPPRRPLRCVRARDVAARVSAASPRPSLDGDDDEQALFDAIIVDDESSPRASPRASPMPSPRLPPPTQSTTPHLASSGFNFDALPAPGEGKPVTGEVGPPPVPTPGKYAVAHAKSVDESPFDDLAGRPGRGGELMHLFCFTACFAHLHFARHITHRLPGTLAGSAHVATRRRPRHVAHPAVRIIILRRLGRDAQVLHLQVRDVVTWGSRRSWRRARSPCASAPCRSRIK